MPVYPLAPRWYSKEDEAMRKEDNRDASAPWEVWPAFGDLGW